MIDKKTNNIGKYRLVIGAHYGWFDWLAQRITAIIILIFNIVVLTWFLIAHKFSYIGWTTIFSHQWMKILTFITYIALAYHAWIGVRDIWMDYIKVVSIRLILHIITIIWLLFTVIYFNQILWRV